MTKTNTSVVSLASATKVTPNMSLAVGNEVVDVAYKQGFRLLTFMQVNQLSEESQARDLFEKAKAKYAMAVGQQISLKGLQPTRAKLKAVFKSGIFNIRGTLEFDMGRAEVEHIELIRQYKMEKLAISNKAIENANMEIERLEKASAEMIGSPEIKAA